MIFHDKRKSLHWSNDNDEIMRFAIVAAIAAGVIAAIYFAVQQSEVCSQYADLPIREVPANCVGYFEQPSSRQSRDFR